MIEQDFREIKKFKRTLNGKVLRWAVYKRKELTIEIRLNDVDHVERLTTSPKKWLDSRIVIPIGKRDERGLPIYKVVRPKEQI